MLRFFSLGRGGHVTIVQTLLDRGVDLNQTFNDAAINQGLTPLHVACE